MEAGLDEDEVMRHYRRIELLFRQLQVGVSPLRIQHLTRH